MAFHLPYLVFLLSAKWSYYYFTIAWDVLYAFSSSFLTERWVSLSCPWAVQMGKLTLEEFCSCDNYPQCSHLWNAKYQWHLIRLGWRTACATNLILVQPAIIVWKCMHSCISVRYMHVCVANGKRKQNALGSVKQEVPVWYWRCQIFAGSTTKHCVDWIKEKTKSIFSFHLGSSVQSVYFWKEGSTQQLFLLPLANPASLLWSLRGIFENPVYFGAVE